MCIYLPTFVIVPSVCHTVSHAEMTFPSVSASRLGRRPKRLKEVGGDGGGGARSHTGNVPIAPYPSPQELYRMRMAELQKVLQTNGTFKAELMQAFLSAAKASFQEHSKTTGGGAGGSGSSKSDGEQQHQLQQNVMNVSGQSNTSQSLLPVSAGLLAANSSTTDTLTSTDSMGMGVGVGGLSGVDSPSSLHSPGGSAIDLTNLAALDTFLFEQGMPSTPGGSQTSAIDTVSELQALNSPFNLNNINLDPVSAATSPFSELGVSVGSPLVGTSSVANGIGSTGAEGFLTGLNSVNLLNQNTSAPSMSVAPVASSTQPQPSFLQQYQQQQQQPPVVSSSAITCASVGSVQVKTEPCESFSSPLVKTEPVSPEPSSSSSMMAAASATLSPEPINSLCAATYGSGYEVNVAAIMEEVRQVPSETRRLLIEQVCMHFGSAV